MNNERKITGEGCFSLTYRKDKQKYFYWKISFAVVLRKDDQQIIEQIKDFIGGGNISFSRNVIRYEITDSKLLREVIIPLFIEHQLIGKKKYDFELWKEALFIIEKIKESQ